MDSILKTIRQSDILKVVLVLIAIFLIIKYTTSETLDNVSSDSVSVPVTESVPVVSVPIVQAPISSTDAPVPSPTDAQSQMESIIAGQPKLTTTDLLPKYDDASQFAKENPVNALLKEQNFLQAGYHIGINTVVQSNKIPYNDIRSCPPIPKMEVGPWGQSSYETPMGYGRKQLE